MYTKFDIFNKRKLHNVINPRELYVVDVCCDANDGDYMRETLEFDKEGFEEDELFLLVLSYVSQYTGKFSPENSYTSYGHHVGDNYDFPWLEEYLSDCGVLIYAGMCDYSCHSVSSVSITYYNEDGLPFILKLPTVDNLFESREEFVEYVNKLYKEYEQA